ncbi:MAG: hypothetical protein OXG68_08445 [Chloroflexi bacterium]|nr:hypothetical protein [Chloroflexota bacterium]
MEQGCWADASANRIADAKRDEHSHQHSDGNTYIYSYLYANSHRDEYSFQYAKRDEHSHQHPNSDEQPDSHID